MRQEINCMHQTVADMHVQQVITQEEKQQMRVIIKK